MKETTAAMLSTSRHRWQAGLIVAQMAIALLLITGAGLLIRSFLVLLDVQPGFRTDHLLTMNFSLPLQTWGDIDKRTRFYDDVIQRLQQLPGVEAVGATTDLPFGWGAVPHNFIIEGRSAIAEGSEPEIYNRGTSPQYFRTMGIAVRRGRVFNDTDRKGSEPVVVINEAAAKQYFPTEDPIGKRVRWAREIPARWMTIVGVVGDIVPSGLDTKETAALYTPYSQESNFWRTWMNIVVRAQVNPASLTGAIGQQVARVDKNIPVAEVYTMDELISKSVADRKFNVIMLASFAGLALLLAAIGIYGVISFIVRQKIHEIGIRVVLGASNRDIYRMILGKGLVLTITGALFGLCASLYLTRFLQVMLFEVSRNDFVTLFAGMAVLIITALFATFLPARKAVRLDPASALRYE